MLGVVSWKWGGLFSALYCNRMRSMLERHLHIPHEFIVVTDEPEGIDERIRIVAPPPEYRDKPRCQRRMWQFSEERRDDFGVPRMLCIDLDVVITADITPLVNRHEPIVCWKVGYAGVYSGSFHLSDIGALDGAWKLYRDDPERFLASTGERNASDQAMLNKWLAGKRIPYWTEADGIVSWFGAGYERLEHHGMGPNRPTLPPGTRLVVLGSADKHVLDGAQFPFVVRHWK